MTDRPFNLRSLATDLSSKMTREKKSLRTAAEEMKSSPATLSRILKGEDTDIQPDTQTLLRAAAWVGKGLADYETSNVPKTSTISDVEVHLRALPGLNQRDADVLIEMVKAAHAKYGSSGKKK